MHVGVPGAARGVSEPRSRRSPGERGVHGRGRLPRCRLDRDSGSEGAQRGRDTEPEAAEWGLLWEVREHGGVGIKELKVPPLLLPARVPYLRQRRHRRLRGSLAIKGPNGLFYF